MKVTREADYATQTIYHLSNMDSDQQASTKSIADTRDIPISFLAKIIKKLAIAGLINTARGSRGGVSLARQPSEISILDVVEAIDGPVMLHDCDADPEDCTFREDCSLHHFWCETQGLLVDRMRNATFDKFGPGG